MAQIELLLRDFFNKHPDIRQARKKGLVNRRALARYIVKAEHLEHTTIDALISVLRRFDTETAKDEEQFNRLLSEVTISTKENIAIIALKKTAKAVEKLPKVISCVDYSRGEILKIVQGALSLKIFIDETNLKAVKEIFDEKDILSIMKSIAELNLVFPKEAMESKGVLSYIASHLAMEGITIIELVTCTPELTLYVEKKHLLKAYEALWKLEESARAGQGKINKSK
ncbi:MAG TPA: hypothetical protein HA362_05525 [Nanoarchaeota archaeon]|nr:hypothetical protein [Nanoarchaeota archaeon]